MQRYRNQLFLLLLTGMVMTLCGGSASGAGSASSIWGADYFPNIPLTTHEGKQVRFFDDLIKDKVVVINFIFTRCPDACPLETARLREVQKILGDRVGKDVFMYSITIDPENDTPEVLKEYAEKFDAGPGWTFLTGKKEDITLLRKKLGLYNEEEEQGNNLAAHSLSLIIGNQSTGQWRKGSPFENPYILATQIGGWLHNWKVPPRERRDYADAPEIRQISAGEKLFRTRCVACHTIGAQLGSESQKPSIGPDLLNVTRNRDREWVRRFIAEPDKMIEEKDPLALALMAQYNNLPMPNLRLTAVEIDALLNYIEEESDRLQHHAQEPAKKQDTHGAGQP
jgi:cytochrome oxidase Cu insertion factor (SCO1/SenC/PrrC family)